MILTEDYVLIPGQQYKVKVQCASIRRLTAMEWLIVNCAARFQNLEQAGDLTLKHVFEEVFQLTSSEILIKPCVESLIDEKAIQLSVDRNFDYSSLRFSQIILTAKGKRMAEDGLFPGAEKELPLEIYYNPLTGKMNQFSNVAEKLDDAIELGDSSCYDLDFPEDKIIRALNAGLVGQGRFVASKLRIESIECIDCSEWKNAIKLAVDVDSDGRITTKPTIQEDRVKPLIRNLFLSKEITAAKTDELLWASEAQPKNILGSGKKTKDSVLNVSKNGDLVAIQESTYSLYKRNTSAYKGKTVVLWNTKEFSVEKSNDSTFISVPKAFLIPGCIVINEKGESISLCKEKYNYDGIDIIVPIVFEDKRIKPGGHTLTDWLECVILTSYEQDSRYLALYTIPALSGRSNNAAECFIKLTDACNVDETISEMRKISHLCELLGTDMIKLDAFGEELWSKFVDMEVVTVLEKLGKIMQFGCFTFGASAQQFIAKNVLEKAPKPTSYNDLHLLLKAIGIKTHQDALSYDVIAEELYTKELIVDTLKTILEYKFAPLPELFELDAFFNEYARSVSQLELLLPGMKLFDTIDSIDIEKAVESCDDVALIQTYVADLYSKHSELLSRNINVVDELNRVDPIKANSYFTRLKAIKRKVESMMDAAIQDSASLVDNNRNGQSKKVFIIDTCALMHNPDLLLYFKDDEYVRIPTKVIDELGKIKDMRSAKYGADLSRIASRLASDIERKYLKLFNSENRMRFMIENADLDLLPKELDKSVPDNQILSVALKYKDCDTTVITDDNVFRLTSIAQSLKTLTGDTFIETHSVYKKTLDRWMEKYVSTGKTLSKSVSSTPNLTKTLPLSISESPATIEALPIDDLPVRELKGILPDLNNEQIFAFLQNNRIKCVRDFRLLTPEQVDLMQAKGKQTVYKNAIKRALQKLPESLGQLQ